jgi:sulfur carrier protein ThiS
MTDQTAEVARLMKVVEAVVAELERQGVAEVLANLGFDPTEMAKAADGDVVPLKR